MQTKRDLDQSIQMLDEQAERIIDREEKILADAKHKIEVTNLIQEKVSQQSKLPLSNFS